MLTKLEFTNSHLVVPWAVSASATANASIGLNHYVASYFIAR